MKKWTPSLKTEKYIRKMARTAYRKWKRDKLSKMEVARRMGVSVITIYRWFSYLDIPNTGSFAKNEISKRQGKK